VAATFSADEYDSGDEVTMTLVTEMTHPSTAATKIADKVVVYTANTSGAVQLEADVTVTWANAGSLDDSYWGNLTHSIGVDRRFDRLLIGSTLYDDIGADDGTDVGMIQDSPIALYSINHDTVALVYVPDPDTTLAGWANSAPLNAYLEDSSTQDKAYHARSTSTNPESISVSEVHSGTVGWRVRRLASLDRDPVTALEHYDLATQTNLLSNDDFTSSWVEVRSGLTTGQADPLGGTDAAKLAVDNAETDGAALGPTYTKDATVRTYVGSVWAKADERDWLRVVVANAISSKRVLCHFDLNTGAVGTDSDATWTSVATGIVDRGSGWYQCFVVATTDTDTGVGMSLYPAEGDNDIVFADSDGTKGLLLFRPELFELP
jgi:hypothetical protein